MRVNYKGMSKDYEYRIVEINFDSEDEQILADRLFFFLDRIKGWSIDVVAEGYAICKVEDKEEYHCFVNDYKSARKMICNCMKFGF